MKINVSFIFTYKNEEAKDTTFIPVFSDKKGMI